MSQRTLILVGLVGCAIVFALIAAQVASRHNSGASGSSETTQATEARNDAYPLRLGSSGPRVAGLQWMLGGHLPSKYRGVNPFKWEPTGYFGERTKTAVKSAKFELGYPSQWVNGAAGSTMIHYLKGDVARPRSYVLTALARKVAADKELAASTARLTMRTRIITLAKRYIGVSEVPLGSNCGHQVGIFQSATGAYCAAWCMSFVQYILKTVGYGTIAYRSAHVFTVKRWAVDRGWAYSQKAKAGRLVIFNSWQGHVGIVTLTTLTGYWTVEGNAGDRVASRFHTYGSRSTTMLQLPGVA